MKISKHEQQAIRTVVDLGKVHGFGNLIAHLRSAWALYLIEGDYLDEKTAMSGVGKDGYPVKMHLDLMEHGEWDETGESYR